MDLNYKLWIEEEHKKVFGDGPCDLLERVERLGSLRKAAAEINMSYSQAWHLIKSLEKRLGFDLIESRSGGFKGGGSSLTRKGSILVRRYSSFRNEVESTLKGLEKKWFTPHFWKEL